MRPCWRSVSDSYRGFGCCWCVWCDYDVGGGGKHWMVCGRGSSGYCTAKKTQKKARQPGTHLLHHAGSECMLFIGPIYRGHQACFGRARGGAAVSVCALSAIPDFLFFIGFGWFERQHATSGCPSGRLTSKRKACAGTPSRPSNAQSVEDGCVNCKSVKRAGAQNKRLEERQALLWLVLRDHVARPLDRRKGEIVGPRPLILGDVARDLVVEQPGLPVARGGPALGICQPRGPAVVVEICKSENTDRVVGGRRGG